MILLWGLMADDPLAAVDAALRRLGADALFINQRDLLDHHFELRLSAGILSGEIHLAGRTVDITQVQAIYLRPYDFAQLDTFSSIDHASPLWKKASHFEEAMRLWCEMSPARVVNRPSAAGSNTSKPYQLDLIRQLGFHVPRTLITTDPAAALNFCRTHPRVICKSLSSHRSIVTHVGNDDLARLDAVQCCPTQFQEWIPGVDYRVHVLADQVFATCIQSSDPDYRYSSATHMSPAQIPDPIADICRKLTRDLNLAFSGIDLRLTPQGHWFCFEVNPSPGFTAFECGTSRISSALAHFLLNPS